MYTRYIYIYIDIYGTVPYGYMIGDCLKLCMSMQRYHYATSCMSSCGRSFNQAFLSGCTIQSMGCATVVAGLV